MGRSSIGTFNVEPENQNLRKIKTRKAEVLFSALLLTLLGSEWKQRGDIEERIDKRSGAAETMCLQRIEAERERAQEIERDLKNDLRELRVQVLTIRGRR